MSQGRHDKGKSAPDGKMQGSKEGKIQWFVYLKSSTSY